MFRMTTAIPLIISEILPIYSMLYQNAGKLSCSRRMRMYTGVHSLNLN